MNPAEKIEIILRSEDNCRHVRDRLLELQLQEEGELL